MTEPSAKKPKLNVEEKSDGPILMIPGPTEFDEDVLAAIGEPSPSHVAPAFINTFGESLEMLRNVLLTTSGQPFILTGSGSLGWDAIVANLCEAGDSVLVVNTGYFSDSFADCLETYGAVVDQVKANVGDSVPAEAVIKALSSKPYKMICLTQVDTSTGVRNNIGELSAAVRKCSPTTLIAVDGVCSFAGEEFRFDDWGIDAAFTGSQKAIGVPPGLTLLMFSQRSLAIAGCPCSLPRASAPQPRTTRIANYYANLKHWLPIMRAYEERKGSYFATPSVNLIKGLHVSLRKLLGRGIERVFALHQSSAQRFRRALKALGLSLVPTHDDLAANTLSAIWYPTNVTGTELLPKIKASGVIVAGGLHRQVKAQYFRVGHMGISSMDERRGHLLRSLEAIEAALIQCGHSVAPGTAARAFAPTSSL